MPDFNNLAVAAFESRRGGDMARLIERHGGRPHVSPSMREVAISANPQAIDFANRLLTGQIDVVIFMTGVGTRHLITQVERHVDRERFLATLSDIPTIARGPKPTQALKELGIEPTYRVPEPNTWREILTLIDEKLPVANLVVAVQEYGQPNPSLIAGLEARGARVETVKVYDWALPEDTGPLEENVRAVAAGKIDVAMFTSANQVVNLMHVAEKLSLAADLRRAMGRMAVCSIGPTTSERLREYELPIDLEPEHPKMGHLVQAAAERAAEILERKGVRTIISNESLGTSTGLSGVEIVLTPFMRACRREPANVTPIWLMRQAGRYMPEYRAVREKVSFLELCKNPQLCSEVMVTAVTRLGVDAAIIFSDLLPILEPMGMDLEFAQGEGPVIHNPIRESGDVDRVVELESADSLHFVIETVRQTRTDLPSHIPLIGFAGAPFTLASYAIEGGASRSYLHTKTLMYRDSGAWNALMARLVRAVARYLNAQIAAGAQAVQIFDSWVGCLSPDDYRRHVMPHSAALLAAIPPDVPVIHFGTGNPMLVGPMSDAFGGFGVRDSGFSDEGAGGRGQETEKRSQGSTGIYPVVGVDWRIRLDEAWNIIGPRRAIQGNLDPMVLLADRAAIRRHAREILDQAAGRPGHIFNLGHGILPQTPVDNVIALVDAVHELSAR